MLCKNEQATSNGIIWDVRHLSDISTHMEVEYYNCDDYSAHLHNQNQSNCHSLTTLRHHLEVACIDFNPWNSTQYAFVTYGFIRHTG